MISVYNPKLGLSNTQKAQFYGHRFRRNPSIKVDFISIQNSRPQKSKVLEFSMFWPNGNWV